MATDNRYLFVSYAREDLDRVLPLVDAIKSELAFRALPVDLWMDVSNLRPGEQWNDTIAEALESSIGFLFFLSPRSLRSEWVRRELEIAAARSDPLIFPVLLHKPLDVPTAISQWLRIDLSGRRTPEEITIAATHIADVTESYLKTTPRPRPVVSKTEAPRIAADIAQQVRAPVEAAESDAKHKSVFVVHGHNTQALATLEDYLSSVGIAAIVLSRQDESPQSLFQKFMSVATQARFAIVLLCADDYGAARRQ